MASARPLEFEFYSSITEGKTRQRVEEARCLAPTAARFEAVRGQAQHALRLLLRRDA